MRNATILTLLASGALAWALAGCSPERAGRAVVGSQSYGEPADAFHTARISGWDRPDPEPTAVPAKPGGASD